MSGFSWVPLTDSKLNHKPRKYEARFGDGYSQRTPQGINNNPQIWNSLRFVEDESVLDEIMAFFEAREGVSSFTWTPLRGVEARFLCSEWSRNFFTKNTTTITAKFEQVFE